MGKKKGQQEMVQVDRSGTSSPFWRSTSSNSSKAAEPRKVIGASYSHADIVKFDALSLSGTGRPRTPPTASHHTSSTPPISRANTNVPSQSHAKPYTGFLRDTSASRGGGTLGDEDDEDDDEITYDDDDEDEFGLPSIASMRRKGKRQLIRKAKDPGGLRDNPVVGEPVSQLEKLWKVDTGDIAEERGIPSYPQPKKTEGKTLRPQYKEILRDPASALHLISYPPTPSTTAPKELEAHTTRISRINKFKRILQNSSVSLAELRDSAWSGIPEEVRAMSWQILLGYLPTSAERRAATLERKRKEYLDGVRQAFDKGTGGNETQVVTGVTSPKTKTGSGRGLDEAIWHQISIDVPRTNPHLELYGYEATQRSLERILYVWAIRHPASGYVQGINDLVTPFWQVFLSMYISSPDIENGMDPGQLPRPVLDAVEADSFWCLTKLLDGIQDNYIFAQPGIQRQVAGLRDLVTRIDKGLANHLEKEGVEFIQFSFRWMNCLLMREISVRNTVRMWDTYLAEDRGFQTFHLYVCAAFLVKWSDKLLHMDFGEIMMFLQSLPTKDWTEKDIELLLSEAFIWQSLFGGSSAHLKDQREGRRESTPGGSLTLGYG